MLRQLLVQNELQRAWKAAGFEKEPQITAPTLAKLLSIFSPERIIFAAAGGARIRGVECVSPFLVEGTISQAEDAAMRSVSVPVETMGLRAFIEAPSIVLRGHRVPRRVVIKFVANKLGGAHLDPRRRGTEEDALFGLLESEVFQVRIVDKDAIYFELLSAGQAVASADDVSRFLSAAGG